MNLEKTVQEIAKNQEIQRQEQYKKDVLEFYTSLQARLYDKASTYTNLIIVAGYALFFTFWGNIKSEVDVFWGKISVILLIISVLFFIMWEIGMMIFTSLNFKKINTLNRVSPDKFETEMNKMKKEEEKFQIVLSRIWFLELLVTIIPGILGVFILVIAYVKTLFK